MVVRPFISILISWRNHHNHNTSRVASDKTIYLASVDESAMIICFFDDQDTTPFPKKMAYPPVDVLSSASPAKSALAYVYNVHSLLPSISDWSLVM